MRKRRFTPPLVLRALAGFACAALFVLPLYWSFVASLGETGVPPSGEIRWWESDPHWENYRTIFETVPLARYTRNSVFVVVFAVPLTVLTASMGGFALSQLGPSSRSWLINASVAMMLVPGAAVWLFRFQILLWLNLLDTLWALVLPAIAATSPLFVLLFYWNFRRVPEDTFEAARLDGANAMTTWWRLALPLSRPTLLGVSVLAFVFYWSDFVSPVLYIYNPSVYTLPIGLQLLNQVGSTNWPVLMAGAVFMTAPVFIFFLFIQRYFLSDESLAGLFDRN